MLVYKIKIECETDEELQALVNHKKNQRLLDELYDTVFRSVIKYSQDKKKVDAYELVWEEVSKYLVDE